MTPTYDLVANEGAVHEPIFVYRVVVGEIVATGKGPSKKKAKHVAAQEALERIRQVVASAAGGLLWSSSCLNFLFIFGSSVCQFVSI